MREDDLLKLAREKLKLKKLDEAIKIYNTILIKDNNNFSANYDLGILYLITKKYELAAKYLEKSHKLNLSHKDADYYYTLAIGRIRKQFNKPLSIHIETTSLCNARCKICPNFNMKREKGIMDDKTFKKIIEDCKEIHPNTIYPFLTGEPFMDKNIIEKINYINKELPNTKVRIFTNASLFNKDIIEKLSSLKIEGIVVSFNGATKNTYEDQMNLNYEKTIENIKLLSKKKISLLMSMVITTETISEIKQFKELCKEININYFLSSFKNYGGKYKIDLKLPTPEKCGRVLTQMTILHDGRISLCCMDNEGDVILGDVKNNSLLEIWNSNKAKEIREKHLNGHKDEIPICKNCTSA